MTTNSLALVLAFAAPLVAPASTITFVPEKVASAIADRQDCQSPNRVHLGGWVGTRIDANATNRLAKLDPARLLEGYRKRPGRQTWDGEHVGKWLHAATLAWANTGDPALREKLDYTAAELIKCQLPDGYLGTYADSERWTQWDVWAHKYNLIGLVTYMRYTGNMAPLPACRRMADLLCNTFGDEPNKRDIIPAGQHMGMAPTSVLEPMVLLYRLTGEPRYLEFCKYILRAWEQPDGPKIVSTLLNAKRVDKVGDGKAYEMLSCLNGALEYYRTVGDRRLLEACLNAWQDIVDHRLYLTGASSYREFFHDDFDLPNVSNVGETCVTVTWLQFNAQLLRLTGEARFAEQLERVVLNQLFGAECPDGSAWGYYVQMQGKKPYSSTLDGHCCLSSGPRGIALIPTFALTTDADGVVVNLYEQSEARLQLRDGTPVSVAMETQYPSDGRIRLTVSPASKAVFALKLRIPAWCPSPELTANGKRVKAGTGLDGYVALRQEWKQGDQVQIQFKLEPRVIVGDHKNEGRLAVLYGPLVLAADEALLGNKDCALNAVGVPSPKIAALHVTAEAAPAQFRTWPGAKVFHLEGVVCKPTSALRAGTPLKLGLVPFADAGATGSAYKSGFPLSRRAPAATCWRTASRFVRASPTQGPFLMIISRPSPRRLMAGAPRGIGLARNSTSRLRWGASSLPTGKRSTMAVGLMRRAASREWNSNPRPRALGCRSANWRIIPQPRPATQPDSKAGSALFAGCPNQSKSLACASVANPPAETNPNRPSPPARNCRPSLSRLPKAKR